MRILIEGGLKISELIGRETDGADSAAPDERRGLRIDDILWSEKAIVVRRLGERRVSLSGETMRLLEQCDVSTTLLIHKPQILACEAGNPDRGARLALPPSYRRRFQEPKPDLANRVRNQAIPGS